jgi:hypothetical protein
VTPLDDLAARIAALEAKVRGPVELDDLPLADLQRRLEQRWQPEASALLAPASVKPDNMEAFPHCEVARVLTPQAIPNAAATAIVWDTVVKDDLKMWNSLSPTIITVPRAGRYIVEANCEWAAATAVGSRALYLNPSTTSNAVPRSTSTLMQGLPTGLVVHQNVCSPLWLPAGATIVTDVLENTVAGTLNCGGPPLAFFGVGTNMRVTFLGP